MKKQLACRGDPDGVRVQGEPGGDEENPIRDLTAHTGPPPLPRHWARRIPVPASASAASNQAVGARSHQSGADRAALQSPAAVPNSGPSTASAWPSDPQAEN